MFRVATATWFLWRITPLHIGCILLGATGMLCGCISKTPPSKARSVGPAQAKPVASAAPAAAETGSQLYLQHCAGCHGERGDGKGIASFVLFPKPRDFRAGQFRLVSSGNLAPRPEDIDAVIVRGMPGSSMPPWPNLSERQRQALVGEVLKFYRDGTRDRFIAAIKEDEGEDAEIDEATVQQHVASRTTPADIVEIPAIDAASDEAIARGKEHYHQACRSCHGDTGKGDGRQDMIDSEGLPTRPRDLTRGIFKGRDDPASVYLRLKIGLPGTPMPATANLSDAQMTDLAHYLLSLSTKETRAAAVLNRERITAAYVTKLPSQGDDVAWAGIEPEIIRLTPLWWRDDAVPAIEVQAAHDGDRIALRLVWDDTTADRFSSRTEAFKDGAAVQLAADGREPFLGMGATGTPVDTWMWDADRGRKSGGDVEDTYPRVVVDSYPLTEKAVDSAEYQRPGTKTDQQETVSLPARAVENPIVRTGRHASGGTVLHGAGPGTVTFRLAKSQLVTAHGQWKDNRWTVVMTRSLAVKHAEDGIGLAAGQRASLAFAVWNGAHQDRNGQKQVSIWQDLELEANPD